MNDKQLLQMLEVLGKRSKSLAASDSVKADQDNDTKCAKAIRNIIENSHSKSLAASAAIPNRNVNKISKISMLTQFILGNGKI